MHPPRHALAALLARNTGQYSTAIGYSHGSGEPAITEPEMAAGVMAAGCRYLDDDLVPLREQGICRPFDRQLGANRRFSAGEYWFGGLKTQQTLRPANKPG
jgi:hypothetical protein